MTAAAASSQQSWGCGCPQTACRSSWSRSLSPSFSAAAAPTSCFLASGQRLLPPTLHSSARIAPSLSRRAHANRQGFLSCKLPPTVFRHADYTSFGRGMSAESIPQGTIVAVKVQGNPVSPLVCLHLLLAAHHAHRPSVGTSFQLRSACACSTRPPQRQEKAKSSRCARLQPWCSRRWAVEMRTAVWTLTGRVLDIRKNAIHKGN